VSHDPLATEEKRKATGRQTGDRLHEDDFEDLELW
jgi:hypothetical protein